MVRDALSHAALAGVCGCAVNGCRPADWPAVRRLCAEHRQLVPNYGVHPWYASNLPDDWLSQLRSELLEDPAAGLGEVCRACMWSASGRVSHVCTQP